MKADKTYVFLGDSITEGVGADKRYTDYLAEMTGARIYNYGVNGAQSFQLSDQIRKMQQEIGERFDTLCIFIGTNDYNASVPVGEFFTEHTEWLPQGYDPDGNPIGTQARKKRELNLDENTFAGRLNSVMSLLREKYGDRDFAFLTPIHRAYAFFGGTNYQPEELYSNRIGEYLDAYVGAIRRAADIWGCGLIDLYRESGLFPLSMKNTEAFFHLPDTDRLHPNAAGHKKLAEAIARGLD